MQLTKPSTAAITLTILTLSDLSIDSGREHLNDLTGFGYCFIAAASNEIPHTVTIMTNSSLGANIILSQSQQYTIFMAVYFLLMQRNLIPIAPDFNQQQFPTAIDSLLIYMPEYLQ